MMAMWWTSGWRAAVGAGRRLEGSRAQRLLLLVVMVMRSKDRQRVRLVAEASCSQQCGGASERLTDAAKEGSEGREGVNEREAVSEREKNNGGGRKVSERGWKSKWGGAVVVVSQLVVR
jgi:hypothetical protein